MPTLSQIKSTLESYKDLSAGEKKRAFFKNSKNDIFLGVKAPVVKKIANEFLALAYEDIAHLMQSHVHEERSLANAILCLRFRKASREEKTGIFNFYLTHRHHIRDWDGVDDSAPYIVGAYLLDKKKDLLYQLVHSDNIWERRIAMVSTWWFIRHGQLEDTFKLAELLLKDTEDLIHKAVGWMLREAGKKDDWILRQFLDKHHTKMPRTMLRYAIERLEEDTRKNYLKK